MRLISSAIATRHRGRSTSRRLTFAVSLFSIVGVAGISGPTTAAEHQVTVSDFKFEPKVLTIQQGDTVTWTNTGGFHNVQTADPQIEDFRCANGCDGDGMGGDGDASINLWRVSWTFNKVGEIDYNCEPHRIAPWDMVGTIIVEAKTTATGKLQFTKSDYAVGEGQSTATVTVSRKNGSDGAAAVMYKTSDGTATAGHDYVSTMGMLNWADGNASDKTFDVMILDDSTTETAETVDLTLSDAQGAGLGTPKTATITIGDDDVPMECLADDTTACLNGGRFLATVVWQAPPTFPLANAFVSDLETDESALFYFLARDPDNLEFLIKVKDGCKNNNHYWVFFAATTDVEYTVTVIDTETGAVKEYENEKGQAAVAVTDITAFATCP